MSSPIAALLADGRLHLQHGPIDLVIEAVASCDISPVVMLKGGSEAGASRSTQDGPVEDARRACFETPASRAPQHDEGGGRGRAVELAYRAATSRFATILDELCAELPELRSPTRPYGTSLRGAVARRMWEAVAPHAADRFVTPMAAVAGAVADAVLAAMLDAAPLARASVNNGGDIALHLGPGERVRVGLVDRPDRPSLFGTAIVAAEDGVGGIATSGWRGRSFSLGIADAVTVLAHTAAEADAAATVIANAVDLPGHPAIGRVPARDVQADSDLGICLVTRAVDALTDAEIADALGAGLAEAEALCRRGLIAGAALHLQGRTIVTTGWLNLDAEAVFPAGEAGRGRRWHGAAVTDQGSPSTSAANPSSDLASRGHLLPRPASPTGEKAAPRPRNLAA